MRGFQPCGVGAAPTTRTTGDRMFVLFLNIVLIAILYIATMVNAICGNPGWATFFAITMFFFATTFFAKIEKYYDKEDRKHEGD
jgi:cbb3-type cytochrome oxidase subunit 3